MNFRPTNPLEFPMRAPTEAELRAMATPSTEEIDRLLAALERSRATPAARWNRIAAAMNRRPGNP